MGRDMKTVNLHLISDSTGETVNTVARASIVQFEGVVANPQIWNLVRSKRRVT